MPIHYWVAFRPSQENSLKIEQPLCRPVLAVAPFRALSETESRIPASKIPWTFSVSIASNIP